MAVASSGTTTLSGTFPPSVDCASIASFSISRVTVIVTSASFPRRPFVAMRDVISSRIACEAASACVFFSSLSASSCFFLRLAMASSAFSAAAYALAASSTASGPFTSPASSASCNAASSRLHRSSSKVNEPAGTSSNFASSCARLASSVRTSAAFVRASNASAVPPRSGCAVFAARLKASRTARLDAVTSTFRIS